MHLVSPGNRTTKSLAWFVTQTPGDVVEFFLGHNRMSECCRNVFNCINIMCACTGVSVLSSANYTDYHSPGITLDVSFSHATYNEPTVRCF